MKENQQKIYNFFKEKGLNDTAIAGIMGNLEQESGMMSNNLQNTYNTKFNLSDKEYTSKVKCGEIPETEFINDNAAYGIGQWKTAGRKKGLMDFAKSKNTTIDDPDMQLEYMWKEMQEKPGLISELNSCQTYDDAAYVFAADFEGCTANMDKRQSNAEHFFNEINDEKRRDFFKSGYDPNYGACGVVGQMCQNIIDNHQAGTLSLNSGDMIFIDGTKQVPEFFVNGLKIDLNNIEMTLFELSEAQNNLTTQANDSIDLNKMLENLFQDQTQCL